MSEERGRTESGSAGRPAAARRRALRCVLWQGALWAIGNALTTGFLITFLALELGAQAYEVGLILAMQSVVGLLRLATPSLVALLGTTRWTCLLMSLASYLLIATLPLVPLFGFRITVARPVAVMIGLLCIHQLLEFIGSVALWSWFADLVPPRIRGRFFGRRNLWQLICVMIVTPASGWFVDRWKVQYPEPDDRLIGYAIVIGAGAIALLASLVPLAMTPARAKLASSNASPRLSLATLVAPFADRTFLPLLLFIAWFSLANGLTQTAQGVYPKTILHLNLTTSLAMVTVMRVGQAGVSLPIGFWSDRWGNRPVLIVCQLLIAAGLLFYWLATPEQPGWLWGAWVLWIAFAGHNICLNNLMLKLAPRENNTSHVAVFFATTSLAVAISTVLGGWLLGYLQKAVETEATSLTVPQVFGLLFVAGWGLRTLGAVLLARIVEPGIGRVPAG